MEIQEKIHDLLSDNGIIVFTFFSVHEEQFGKGEKCEEENTFMTKGKPNHYFNEEEIKGIALTVNQRKWWIEQ